MEILAARRSELPRAACATRSRRNRIVALLIDQDTRGAGVFVPFFGRPARTPPGAAVLALRTRVPVLHGLHRATAATGGHLIRFAPVPIGADAAGGIGSRR